MSKAAKIIDVAGDNLETAISSATTICAAVGTAAELAVPFGNFLPLIGEVAKIFQEIVDIYQTAEHNKRTCGVLLDRVQVAETAVKNLKNRREENVKFFSEANYFNLQKLVKVISKMRKFAIEISQIKGLQKYILAKNMKDTADNLNKEFDSTIQLLQFSFMVDFNSRADSDSQKIQEDIKDLDKYLEIIEGGITDVHKNVSEAVVQLNALHHTVNQILDQKTGNQVDNAVVNVFQTEFLPFNDYEETGNDRNPKLRKFKIIKNGLNDFVALKFVVEESSKDDVKNKIRNQVTILKKLEKCRNIIQFFGLTTDGSNWYLVTEWAEYGNLREYYVKYGPLDVKEKLGIALDIARGLNFLRAVEIVHRDIRAENILITDHQTAKITNFSSSRAVTDGTQNQAATIERVRYCAPEKLGLRSQSTKYDTKSEIYSFGILLWEIAEEKIPYEKHKEDIIAITELVSDKRYREPFSPISPLPKEYQEISQNAVHHDPSFRPPLTKIFTVLQEIHLRDGKPPPSPRPAPVRQGTVDSFGLSPDEESDITIAPNFADFNYMTVDEAARQHKIKDGNLELAFKCFEAYSDLDDMKAKYFKAYYIQQKLVNIDMDQKEKDELVASLFKEVADSGDEYPEAQLRYGNCLIKGIGIKKSIKEAAKYFTKAADNGQVVGMFNAASLYFSGGAAGGKKDPALGERYMKLAAYKQHVQAIEFCKKNNIPL